MNTKPVTVTDSAGKEVPAELVICPDCRNDSFHIFDINGHKHIQCTACGHSFCDGTCATDPTLG